MKIPDFHGLFMFLRKNVVFFFIFTDLTRFQGPLGAMYFRVLAGASNLYAEISGWLEPCGKALNGDREALKRTFRSNRNALKGDEPGAKGG